MPAVTFEDAQVLLAARLSQGAFRHSVGVAETATELATRYGVDVEAARLAGLLHDWDRERSHEDLVREARDAGLSITEADSVVPYLLHARTGAAALRLAFPGLADAVVRAVAHHTVGSAEMSALDQVVYVADMIEPGRDYEGVDELRALVGEVGLDELFAAAYQQSVTYLIRNRKRIHPDTVAVWNALIARGQR